MAQCARAGRRRLAKCAFVPAAALILAGGAAGCNASPQTPATSAQTASTTAARGSSPTSAPTTLLTAAQLRAALLTPAELGPTFTSQTSTGGTADNSAVTGCEPLVRLLNGGSGTTQGIQEDTSLVAGSTGPFVLESLLTEDADALAADYGEARTALASCHSLTFPTGAEPLTFILSPVTFGGPGSTAVRMDGTYRGTQVNGYLAVEQLGSVALTYAFFQAGGGSSQLASAYYRQAVNKIDQVLGSAATSRSPG